MHFVKGVAQSLRVAEGVAQRDTAPGEPVSQLVHCSKRLVDSLDIALGDRREFCNRAPMARDDEAFPSLDAFEQGRKMSFGFVGSDLVHGCVPG